MTTTFADAVQFNSTVDVGSAGYFVQIKVGNGTPGNATGDDDCYVKGDFEVDGKIYADGNMEFTSSTTVLTVDANRAAALTVNDGTTELLHIDTTTGALKIDFSKTLIVDDVLGIKCDDDSAHRLPHWYRVALTVGAGAGDILNLLNPIGASAFVLRLLVRVTTVATGACTLDFGCAASATSSDTLIDGLDVNTAIGAFSNVSDPGTNGNEAGDDLGATEYVTGSVATGDSTGLVGYAYIEIMPQ